MHQDRFYIPNAPATNEIWLDGREAHHILHVKRAKLGAKITLFDGEGFEYLARITEIFHDTLKVCIEQSNAVDREAPVDITLAFSIPKGKLVTFLIQKCAELGVRTLIPIHCERSVVDIRDRSETKIEKWDKIVIEASKQCKRNSITKIKDVMPLDSLIKAAGNYDLSLIACTETHTKTLKGVLNEYPSLKKIICLIGPEGGFTNNEIEMAKEAGFVPISIGTSTLRIETAAIAITSMLLCFYA
ncbi:MAG: Ribosomal RNA small subunit methyltransferase E [Candidatus Jettenia ecosi]|uniref:Ribosomal RNA small subunit methyltransferase E n=1 Tax=Candidatus Jettenia ecosi TaxID=2494326 RepID=A0A533QBA7_9BACT|nr:MAG: Ribosomal RNA small subunit methyltransferase E [Candidatus Jettenia ecosi]